MPPVVLICGAFAPEIDLLLPLAGRRIELRNQVYELRVIESGIGALNSGLRVAEALRNNPEAELLFVGSAGAYRQDQTLLQSFAFAKDFRCVDLAVVCGQAKALEGVYPSLNFVPGEFASVLAATPLPWVTGTANSTNSISLCAAEEFSASGLDFENLECYGIALAATKARRPFSAALALTNLVGPQGSEEWRRNYRTCSLKMQNGIVALIDSLSI